MRGVAAIDAARGEAQREGAAVEVVREETTRPIGTGEPTRGRPRSAAAVAMEAATTPEVATAVVQAAESAREPVSASQAEELSPALGPVSVSQGLADSIDYQVRDDGSIRVEATETLGQYADWLQIPTQKLRNVNKLKAKQPVLLGQKLNLDYSRVSREAFEQLRRDYHAKLQGEFFVQHRIAGTEVYIVRRGDSLWTMTQKFSNLPIWLLRQYNPDTDLSDLRAGHAGGDAARRSRRRVVRVPVQRAAKSLQARVRRRSSAANTRRATGPSLRAARARGPRGSCASPSRATMSASTLK